MKLTSDFAEILGLLCAEGCHVVQYSSYWGTDRGKKRFYKNKKSERIEFYNKDTVLLEHMQSLLLNVFDYSSTITNRNKINIARRDVVLKIINHTELGNLKWRVPDAVKTGKVEIKKSFLRGYFDGDGTCSGRVKFFSSNYESLLEVSSLLKDLRFKHTVQGPIIKEKRKPSYIIQISEKERKRFLNVLAPISKRPDIVGVASKKNLQVP